MKHGNLAVFVPHIGCPHRCSFCDQRTISGKSKAPAAEDVRELCKRAAAENDGRELELAFFGGSFTAIDEDYMCSLLAAASEFAGSGISGIRMSTRPDCVGEKKLELLSSFPVTAIELGAQSMNDKVLQKNGRGHTAHDVVSAAKRIHKFGFELGLQMMIGLDGEKEGDEIKTALEFIKCRPDTVRIYPTLIIEGTELSERLKRGEYKPLSLEEGIERTSRVMELFWEKSPDTRIIRVGLHPSAELERSLLAGPYHPAFRELCESRIMLKRLLVKLVDREKGYVEVGVRPQDISRMVGQKRANMNTLKSMGYDIKLLPDESVSPMQVKLI